MTGRGRHRGARARPQSRDPLEATRADAIKLHKDGRTADAIPLYRAYLRDRPDDAAIWTNLGVALRERKRLTVAEACYRRALELAPGDLSTLGNLGNVLKDMDRLDEAIAMHEAVLAESPQDERARHNHAIALREAARYADAAAALDRLVEEKPDNPTYRWDRALVLLHLGRSDEGWRDYEARKRTGDTKPRRYRQPEWRGEPLAGKTLYLYPEQGFGDTLMVARFLPALRSLPGAAGAPVRVIVECRDRLRRLLDGTPGIDRLAAPAEKVDEFDLHCSLMSLPGLVGGDVAAPPPPARLTVPEGAGKHSLPLLRGYDGRFKVGIVWSGSVTYKGNAKRAVNIDRFLSLATVPGVQLFSLQKGPREGELKAAEVDPVVIDIAAGDEDLADAAAAILALDLVIMTDSAIAHLCGSLGRPIWNLLAFHPYWIYPVTSDRTPWYPSMRLFRQPAPGNWDAVFADARTALAEAVAAKAIGQWPPQAETGADQ